MEIQIPETFLVRECPECRTNHAPIRDCPDLGCDCTADYAENVNSSIHFSLCPRFPARD